MKRTVQLMKQQVPSTPIALRISNGRVTNISGFSMDSRIPRSIRRNKVMMQRLKTILTLGVNK